MSDPGVPADTMQVGLLMEAAHAHQQLAATHLEKLREHTESLDDIVRDVIQRTLVDEIKGVTNECDRAARMLRDMPRSAQRRALVWSVASLVLCAAIPGAIVHLTVPSPAAIAALRTERDALVRSAALIARQGGKAQLRECGSDRRLCIRVDRHAPVYGEHADFYIIGGY